MRMQKPWYQRVWPILLFIAAGFLAVATFLDAINNAISLITPGLTWIGTAGTAMVWGVIELLIRKKKIYWISADEQPQRTWIKELGKRYRWAFVGMILLFWTPRIIELFQPDLSPEPVASVAMEALQSENGSFSSEETPLSTPNVKPLRDESLETPSPLPQKPDDVGNLFTELAHWYWEESDWVLKVGDPWRSQFGTIVAVDPTNDDIVVLGSPTGKLIALDFSSGADPKLISRPESDEHQNRITGILFSKTPTFLVTSSFEGNIRFWHYSDGHILEILRSALVENGNVNTIAQAGGQGWLAVGLDNGLVEIRDPLDLQTGYVYPAYCRNYEFVRAPIGDRNTIPGCVELNAFEAPIWDLAFTQWTPPKESSTLLVAAIAHTNLQTFFIPDDAATMRKDSEWDIRPPDQKDGNFISLATSSIDGQTSFLVANNQNRIGLWENNKLVGFGATPSELGITWVIAISPDGKMIAAGTNECWVYLLAENEGSLELVTHQEANQSESTAATYRVCDNFVPNISSRIQSLAFSNDV